MTKSPPPPTAGSGSPLAELYLIHKTWAKDYLSPSARTPILNAPLLDKTRSCTRCHRVVLRRDIIEGRDYYVVDADKWGSLLRDNTCDVEICRYRHVASFGYSSNTAAIKGEKVVKGESKKSSKEAKAQAASAVARAPPQSPVPDPMELDLYPTDIKLYFWDDVKQRAVVCGHPVCGHAMRLCLPLGTYPSIMTCVVARILVTARADLDDATREWLEIKSSRQGVDILYWDFGLSLWVLWRGHTAAHKLPDDATALRSSKTGESRACLRKRLTADEEDDHVKTVKAARAAARATARATTSAGQTDKGNGKAKLKAKATTTASSTRVVGKPKTGSQKAKPTRTAQATAATTRQRALGKRRRAARDDDEDDEDEEDDDDEDDASSCSSDEAGSGAAAVADEATAVERADSQETVDTQPDAACAVVTTVAAQMCMYDEDELRMFRAFQAFSKSYKR